MKKFLFFFIVLVLVHSVSQGQVTVSGSNGADGPYSTLGAAFSAINGHAHAGLTISVSVTGNTNEGTSAAILNANTWSSLTITPTGLFTISGATTAGNPLVDLNGADNVYINGYNSGGRSLTISNTTVSATANTCTVRFINDATNNTVTNCTISGSATNTAGGTIFFSTGTTSGNDGNSITNCVLNPAGSNLPTNAIYSAGTSAAINNSGIYITSNNIQDYFNSAAPSNGIFIASNSSSWNISGNRFFQTATRTSTAGAVHHAINIVTASGTGYSVTTNVIGCGNAGGGGITIYDGSFANRFAGIEMTVGTFPPSSVQGNIINYISLSTTSTASAPPGIFTGISLLAGAVDIGTTTGNTVGATSGTGTISITDASDGGFIGGIYASSAATVNIQNNFIGAIAAGGSSTIGYVFSGIYFEGSGTFTVTANTVGNPDAADISIGDAGSTTATCNVYGICSYSIGSVTIGSAGAGNTLRNLCNNSTNSPSATRAIANFGVITGTSSISYNSIDNLTFSAESTAAVCYAITNTSAANTSTLTISNNTIGSNAAGYTSTSGGIAPFYGIYQTGTPLNETISGNVFNALSFNSALGVYLIYNAYTAPANGSKTIQNNQVVSGFTRTLSGSGDFCCYYDNGSSPGTVTHTISGNSFTNIDANTTGNYSFYGIYSMDFSGSYPTLNVYNNTISNIIFNGTSSSFIMYLGGFSGTSGSPNLVYGNTVSGFTNSGSGSIVSLSVGFSGMYVNAYNNTIQNFFLSGPSGCYGIWVNGGQGIKVYNNLVTGISNSATGTIYGINAGGQGVTTVYQNQINNLTSHGNVHGIYVSGSITFNIYQHKISGGTDYSIHGLTSNGLTSVANGITINGANSINIYDNSIYDITNNSAGSTVPLVNGFSFINAVNAYAYNNLIGELYAPNANYADAIRGISITSAMDNVSGFNIYYNTVHLTATSAGTNFGATGIFHTTKTNATYQVLTLRNNIIINDAVPNGSGRVVAYRISDATLTNFGALSNNNIFYAGSPGSSNLIFFDGINADQTLAAYQARVAPRDAASYTEDTPFLGNDGSVASFLHIDPAASTFAESRAVNIASYTDDFDGNIRQGNTGYTGSGTAPDIGADEGDFTSWKVWNGSVSDSWNTNSNWTPTGVPALANNVTIPSGTTNACKVHAAGMLCRDLNIRPGAALYIDASTDLTVNRNLTVESGGSLNNTGTLHLKGNLVNQNP